MGVGVGRGWVVHGVVGDPVRLQADRPRALERDRGGGQAKGDPGDGGVHSGLEGGQPHPHSQQDVHHRPAHVQPLQDQDHPRQPDGGQQRQNLDAAGIGMIFGFANATAFSLLMLYNQQVLRLGPVGYGLLLAARSVGGILGGLAAMTLARSLAATGVLLLAAGLAGAGHLLLGLTSHPLRAGAMLALSSFAFGLWNLVSVSLRQRLA